MNIEAFQDYVQLERQMSYHTVRAYVDDLKSFHKFCVSEQHIVDVNTIPYSIIRDWIVYLVDTGVSNRTINRKISSLKAYFNFLVSTDLIQESPFVQHKPLRVSRSVAVPFSLREMENAAYKIRSFSQEFEEVRDALMVELFYSTGIRRSELIILKLNDVSLEEGYIKINGKRSRERYIPLTQSCIEGMKKYLPIREKFSTPESNSYFFITKRGKMLNTTLVFRVVGKTMKAVSSKSKVGPHMLRHTMATHLLDNGADINSVKELLGHSSLASTQVYLHSGTAEFKEQYLKAHPRNNNENEEEQGDNNLREEAGR